MSKKDEALKLALEALKQIDEAMPFPVAKLAQAALREALAEQPAQQALDKMAENARELGLDYEPVPEKFMDALKFDVAMREALAEQPAQQEPVQNNPLDCNVYLGSGKDYAIKHHVSYGPAQQEPVAWKLVPREPTHEMLKAMDECSTEGYDERLYAGHAASVYMAAVDAAPTPPAQRKPLTEEEIFSCENSVPDETVTDRDWCIYFARAIEAKLKEKNNG